MPDAAIDPNATQWIVLQYGRPHPAPAGPDGGNGMIDRPNAGRGPGTDIGRRRRMDGPTCTLALSAGVMLMAIASPAHASGWTVRAQANGSTSDSGYGYCGSSDAQVNCGATTGKASGSVTYADDKTTIKAGGEARSDRVPNAIAGGTVTADLATATIRQSNSNIMANSGTAGLLTDTLTFALADPDQVYAIPFSYSFDGGLSGDTVGEFHPGMFAKSDFSLGSANVGSSQDIGESGPAYFAPTVSLNNGSGAWIDTLLTQTMYGYTISGKVLVGGNWGTTLGFDMDSQVSCANEYGSANCDYGHTQIFGFGTLPTGVTYSSASGVFLKGDPIVAAVPEPASWSMLITGFGLIGGTLRRGRRQPRVATA
jgi:hypothetical protein